MTPEEQEYEQEMDALHGELITCLQELRELTRSHGQSQGTPWRYDLDPDAAEAYVEEIRRRQPSAFRK